MHIIVLVVSGKKKPISSTAGMQTSIQTSDLLSARLEVLPYRITEMKQAIQDKDYQKFAKLTMQDSNQMHAVCLDTYPPISYMTDTSRDIVSMIHGINEYYGEAKACYTYDAGPNACLYVLKENLRTVLGVVKHFFKPDKAENGFIRGLTVDEIPTLNAELLAKVPISVQTGRLQYVLVTKVGPGPLVLNQNETLLSEDGLPKHT